MKEKRSQHRQGGVVEGKGFYIVLFLCVAAIGISGYYLFSGLAAPVGGFGATGSATAVSGQAEIQTDPGPSQTPLPGQPEEQEPKEQQTAAPEPEESGEKEAEETKEPPAPAAPDEEAAASTAYVWPVQGEVARDFSLEVFAYDDTMGDWRTHSGLDISAELGAPVSACAKGTVSDISEDPMMGKTIRIDHGMGMETVYANLAESVNVQVGDEVEAGTVLGAVGDTARAESASPSHLHFEMVEYGVSIDPLHYLH